MPASDIILTGAAALWGGFVVYRLETLRMQYRDLWQRLTHIEEAVCEEDG